MCPLLEASVCKALSLSNVPFCVAKESSGLKSVVGKSLPCWCVEELVDNCKTSQRLGGAHIGFPSRVDIVWNRTELLEHCRGRVCSSGQRNFSRWSYWHLNSSYIINFGCFFFFFFFFLLFFFSFHLFSCFNRNSGILRVISSSFLLLPHNNIINNYSVYLLWSLCRFSVYFVQFRKQQKPDEANCLL